MKKKSALRWKVREDGKIILLHHCGLMGEFSQISNLNNFLKGWFHDDAADISWIRTAR